MLAPFGIRPKGTLQARMLPLAQALTRRGWRVVIVAPALQNPEDAGTRVDYAGVAVLHTPRPHLAGSVGVGEQVAALAQAALAERSHLIHLFKPKGHSGLAALLTRALRPTIPLVLDSDDWEGRGGWNNLLAYPAPAKMLFNWQERDLPRRAAAVTVASRTLQTQVWGFGVRPERVFYLPNGVQPAAQPPNPTPPSQPPTLLLYTRFWEFSLRPFVQTLVVVFNRHPTARLQIIGKGERGEETELLRLAARAGIAERIDYCGWVEPGQIAALLASATIALAPLDDTLINRARGMAKLLELMQAGLPIIAQRVGAAAEYLEAEYSGLLTAPGDSAAFASATLRLLADPALCAQLGAHARKRAETSFSWDMLAQVAEQAYMAATDDRR